MKAAVLVQTGQPLEVMDGIELPALETGQVLTRIHYTGVCHSQLMEVSGKRGDDPWLPHLLGHEASATVVDIGPGVTKVKPGDPVVLTWIKSKGLQASGAKYQCGELTINSGAVTTFNEYSVVSENRCVAIPKDIPLDIASLFGCAVMTGAGIVTNTLKPPAGSSLVVYGVGGIGLSALMAAKVHQCNPIIAVDVSDDKLKQATEFGATHTVNAKNEDPVAAIRVLTNDLGTEFAVESAGLAHTIEQAFNSVRKGGGYCVFASHPASGEKVCLDPFDMICGKRIEGSWGGDSNPDEDIPLYAELYLQGKMPLEKLITHRYSLDQINKALEDMKANLVGRALLKVS